MTSVTLLAGLSVLVIKLDSAEIKELSLAFMVGSSLNIFFKIMAYFGYFNEPLDILDVSEMCYIALSKNGDVELETEEETYGELDAYLKGSHLKTEKIEALTYIKMFLDEKRSVLVKSQDGNLSLRIETVDDNIIAIRNDFISRVVFSKQNQTLLEFIIDDKMSKFMLKSICRYV